MPTAWKRAKLGVRFLASTLGDKAKRGVGDSPLVVQAGFPTSVADLVVKNRGRLKKTPRWLRFPGSPEGADGGCSTMAVVASQIVAAPFSGMATRRPRSSPGPAESEQEREEGRFLGAANVKPRRDAISEEEELQSPPSHTSTSSEARSPKGKAPPKSKDPQSTPRFKAPKYDVHQASPRSKTPTSEGPESSPREERRKPPEEWNRRGLDMTAKVVFLVFVLAIGTKKMALGVSVSAFAILFLESVGRRLVRFLKPCWELKKKRSGTVAVSFSVSDVLRPPDGFSSSRNGRVPIKTTVGFCDPVVSSQSGRSSDSKIPVALISPVVQTPVPASQAKDDVEAEGSREVQKACPLNRNTKKLLRKFVPKKLRGAMGGRGRKLDGKPDLALDSSSRGASCRRGEGEGRSPAEEEDGGGLKDGNGDGEEGGGGGRGLEIPTYDECASLKDAAFLEEKVDEPTNGNSGHLVFFLIILSGLIGGRVVAMVLTVLWSSAVSSASRSLGESGKMHQKPVEWEIECPLEKIGDSGKEEEAVVCLCNSFDPQCSTSCWQS